MKQFMIDWGFGIFTATLFLIAGYLFACFIGWEIIYMPLAGLRISAVVALLGGFVLACGISSIRDSDEKN